MNPNFTELDFMHECNIRGLYLEDIQMNWRYKYLMRGYQGEKIMYDWLLLNLPTQAVILHDTWMQYRGTTQLDFLILCCNVVWIIEVKHYNGYFQYKDNVCTLNDQRMDKDHIAQMRNRMLIMNDIIKQSNQNIKVKGTIIFTHQNSEITIPPEPDFSTLTLNQVHRYFNKEIKSNIRGTHQNLLNHLSKFETSSTFVIPTLTDCNIHYLKKGVYCPKCFSFNLKTSDRKILCQECYYREMKRETMVRQYCCQGVLFHNKKLITNKEIHELSKDCFSASNLRQELKSKLRYTYQGKLLSYINYALPYEKFRKKLDSLK